MRDGGRSAFAASVLPAGRALRGAARIRFERCVASGGGRGRAPANSEGGVWPRRVLPAGGHEACEVRDGGRSARARAAPTWPLPQRGFLCCAACTPRGLHVGHLLPLLATCQPLLLSPPPSLPPPPPPRPAPRPPQRLHGQGRADGGEERQRHHRPRADRHGPHPAGEAPPPPLLPRGAARGSPPAECRALAATRPVSPKLSAPNKQPIFQHPANNQTFSTHAAVSASPCHSHAALLSLLPACRRRLTPR